MKKSKKAAAGALSARGTAREKAKKQKRRYASLPARTEPVAERLPYPGGFPVYLSRYVLFGGQRPRAALRFYNASDVFVTGVRFRLSELDSGGNVIGEHPVERRGLAAERGAEFAVADAAVSPACASVEAKLEAVFSEPYEYVAVGDGVSVRYGTEEREKEYEFRKKPSYSVKKRKKRYVLISLAAVLGAVLAAFLAAWRAGLLDGVLPDGQSESGGTEITYVCGDGIYDVET